MMKPHVYVETKRRQLRNGLGVDQSSRQSCDFRRGADHQKPPARRRARAGMLAAGDTPEIVLQGYPWLEPDDIRACLVYARRLVGHERIEPPLVESSGS